VLGKPATHISETDDRETDVTSHRGAILVDAHGEPRAGAA
jgi:hypothetical protein